MTTPPATLIELLENSAEQFSQFPALSINQHYRTYTYNYQSVLALARGTSNWLAEQGVNPGDRVMIMSPNSPQLVIAMWGIWLRGASVVPLNLQSTKDMLSTIADSCQPRLFLSHSRFTHLTPDNVSIKVIDELLQLVNPAFDMTSDAPTITSDTIAEVLYTSGTTGVPKGVMLSHKNLLTTTLGLGEKVPLSTSDQILSILPLSHIYEQVVGLLAPLQAGAHIRFLHRPSALLPLLNENPITKMAAVPEFLHIIMSRLEQKMSNSNLAWLLSGVSLVNRFVPWIALRRIIAYPIRRKLCPTLSIIACGGSALNPELERKWNSLGITLLQGYGMTEISGVATLNTITEHSFASVGVPIKEIEIKIAEDGEILIRGKSVMVGYFNNPELTASVISKDGWFHTGDNGVYRGGFLYLKGRKKYMIKGQGAQNVYPEDIESVIDAQPNVVDSCVVPVEIKGHTHIVALIRPKPGSTLALDLLQKRVNQSLASYQLVNTFLIWPDSDFSRSASRKIKRDPVQVFAQAILNNENLPQGKAPTSGLITLLSVVTGLGAHQIKPESILARDLNLDSLMRVELVARIELDYGVLIDETKINQHTTVEDLETLIKTTIPSIQKNIFVHWPLHTLIQKLRQLFIQPLFLVFSRMFFKLHVYGLGKLPTQAGPYILMPNHLSIIDSIAVTKALPKTISARLTHAAGADLKIFHFSSFVSGLVRLLLNVFPLPRTAEYRYEEGLLYTGWIIDQGYSVCIFPEGTTKDTDEIYPLKEGAGLIATLMNVPVIPVYIMGTNLIVPPHTMRLINLNQTVHVRFGAPLYFKTTDQLSQVNETIKASLEALRLEQLALSTVTKNPNHAS